MKIELTNFAMRHFDKKFGGTKILDKTPEEFLEIINGGYSYIPTDIPKNVSAKAIFWDNPIFLRPGYAGFCKLLFIKNTFSRCKTGTMQITLDNYSYLRSDYSARRASELPVMSRWFEIPKQFIPKAKWFNVILYTRDQLYKEWLEGPDSDNENGFELSDDCEFGIVAILAQETQKEEPMKPETMARNYMPLEYGGSGMEYPTTEEGKEKFQNDYKRSVSFWEQFATVK